MKTNIYNRLIGSFEKDIYGVWKQRIKDVFEADLPITIKNKDSDETRKLIMQHNAKVKEYNKLGELLAMMIVRKMDQFKPQPQDDFLGAVDECLRLRSLKKNKAAFRFTNSQMYLIEQKLAQLGQGTGGIEDLQKQIEKSRKGKK